MSADVVVLSDKSDKSDGSDKSDKSDKSDEIARRASGTAPRSG